MPPRRKNASAKQRKAELQLKRAIKRGDEPAPVPSTSARHGKRRIDPKRADTNVLQVNAGEPSSRRLQSSFVKLSPEFLGKTKHLASTLPLHRPILREKAIFPAALVDRGDENRGLGDLTVPKRPKWKYDMEKKEVEKNEEGIFVRWLGDTNKMINGWLKADLEKRQANSPEPQDPDVAIKAAVVEPNERPETATNEMPLSSTHYEQNLEVWRQLWRVTEISQILLILLDSRCPPLHYPPSLHAYLSSLRPARKLILVLTKVDICGPTRAALWSEYLSSRYPGVRVIQVESYIEKAMAGGQGKRKHFDPHIPTEFRTSLVETLKEVHEELCTPSLKVRENPERLKTWKPDVRRVIDWQGVLTAGGRDVGKEIGGALFPKMFDGNENENESDSDYLTIGLIGQPNVGKSSLLNALFGAHKVKASRTPGKTKHFQTLFWTPQVRLVDCPGLVMPNYVPLEMQVLSGILPISQISSIPSCIYLALQYIPLEQIYGLKHPTPRTPAIEDKRTWRGGTRPVKETEVVWTAMDVLTAYAELKGWVTAKAGRPDVNRAGNHILRQLSEARIKWAFWPPDTKLEDVRESEEGMGICVGVDEVDDGDISDVDSEVEEERARSPDKELESDESEDKDGSQTDDSTSVRRPNLRAGMFGALASDDSEGRGSGAQEGEENAGD